MRPARPEDAIGTLSGLYFKVGRFNRAYYWNGEDWLKSARDPGAVQREILKKKNKFAFTE